MSKVKLFEDHDRADYLGSFHGHSVFVSQRFREEPLPAASEVSSDERSLFSKIRFMSVLRCGYFGEGQDRSMDVVVTTAPFEEADEYVACQTHGAYGSQPPKEKRPRAPWLGEANIWGREAPKKRGKGTTLDYKDVLSPSEVNRLRHKVSKRS